MDWLQDSLWSGCCITAGNLQRQSGAGEAAKAAVLLEHMSQCMADIAVLMAGNDENCLGRPSERAAGEMKSCCAHLTQALHPVEELILVG